MKRSNIIVLSIMALLLSFGLTALAQEGKGEWQGKGRPMMQTPEERLDSLAKQLNLTDDQKAKVKTILQTEFDKMKALRENQSLSREDRRDQMMSIRKSTDDAIKAVLNPDQLKKFEEMQSKMMEHRKEGPPPPKQ